MPKPDLLSDVSAPSPEAGSGSTAAIAAPANGSGFQLRGASFTVLVLRISDPKDAAMFQSIADKVAQAPNFFRHAPVVIDLQDMAASPPFNIAELGRRLRQHQLVPIGIQNATEEQIKAATNAGLSLFPEGRKAPLATPTESREKARERAASEDGDGEASRRAEAPSASGSALVITQPVRSGQRIYAHATDLVVLSSISPGAELLADGHIHVYGVLRGRALAGVSGDIKARIFCHSLEAELVSVAGYWRVREDLPDALIGKAAQISLAGERLGVEALP
jgi:septum site-determining protein MinC